ncbi:MAG: Co2+/Mg2+ efflux protein ApaG [Pseudomonadota bacterium]
MISSDDIAIDVSTRFLDDQSEPDAGRFVFAYTIRISNHGDLPAQLRRRHWVITDSNGKVQEVRGDGVVGEQPTLNPGSAFEYSSGAIIETPVGSMQGEYEMSREDGSEFAAPIAPFTLAIPGILQ